MSEDREKFARAARGQARSDTERRYRAGELQVTPLMVSYALDAKGLYGPEVDRACLAAEPEVDLWEKGLARPSWEQLQALAELTGVLVEFFFRPAKTTPTTIMCGPSGCTAITSIPAPEPYSTDMAVIVPLSRQRTQP